jgi:hypothetical protein
MLVWKAGEDIMGSEQSKQNAQMPSETPASGSRVTKLVTKSHVS